MNQPIQPVPPVPPPTARGRTATVAALVLVVVGIIVVAFRGSWGAMRDAALAAHFDRSAADLYPFAVDGLLVVAILAAVLLRHDRGARQYCLGIIAAYTGASWLLNFLHGLGQFTPAKPGGPRPVPPWPVVVVIASLVIGSIFLGSHLLVFVWRHLFPTVTGPVEATLAGQPGPDPVHDVPAVPLTPPPPPDALAAARAAYRHSLAPGMAELSQRAIVDRYGISKRQAARVQASVKAELAADTVDEVPPEAPTGADQNGHGTP